MRECSLIRDVLPLYIDEICSSETKEYIAGHLQDCAICRKAYEDMARPTSEPAEEVPQQYLDEVAPLKKIRRNQKIKSSILLILLSFSTVLGKNEGEEKARITFVVVFNDL